jgi:hypothetical protein
MLAFLGGKAGERKLRLWVCACCRRVGHLLAEPGRLAVEVAERLADGAATAAEVSAARVAVRTATRRTPVATPGWYTLWAAQAAVGARLTGRHPLPGGLAEHAARQGVSAAADWALATAPAGGKPLGEAYVSSLRAESAGQAALLRCILGSPFCPVTPDPAWLAWHGGAIVQLARAVYEERELPSGHLDAARLAILADMLEEAGATDPDLLGHLRSPGPHVRGCVAVDALLGRP